MSVDPKELRRAVNGSVGYQIARALAFVVLIILVIVLINLDKCAR